MCFIEQADNLDTRFSDYILYKLHRASSKISSLGLTFTVWTSVCCCAFGETSDEIHADAVGMGDDGRGARWAVLVRRRGVAISALRAH